MPRSAHVSFLRRRHFCESVSLLVPLVVLFLATACGKETTVDPVVEENTPPRIERILIRADRVHAAEDVSVSVVTDDVDGDRLRYRWSATRGEFPIGPGTSGTVWRTARQRGVDTLRILVYDFEDSVRAVLPVPLVLPAGPESLGTTSFSNQIDVLWDRSGDDGISNWVGYDVFMDTASLVGKTLEELELLRVNAEPVRGTRHRVLGLQTGQKYFFEVRSRREYDGTIEQSEFVEETDAAPRPDGTVSFFRELQSVTPVAFDISAGRVRSINVSDPTRLADYDLYLGTTEPDDLGEFDLVFKSVSELGSRNAGWAERVVQIKPLGFDWSVAETDDEGWGTTAILEDERVYAVKTPEGNYGKFQVTGRNGFFPNRNVWILWAYQTLPGYPKF